MRRGEGKYGVAPVAERTVDGITFASQAEARRYGELKMLEKAGEIDSLQIQIAFPLEVRGEKIAIYVADFVYRQERPATSLMGGWMTVVEDVKGVRTPLYKLKKKIFEANYGMKITEVPARAPRPPAARARSRRSRASRGA